MTAWPVVVPWVEICRSWIDPCLHERATDQADKVHIHISKHPEEAFRSMPALEVSQTAACLQSPYQKTARAPVLEFRTGGTLCP